MAATFAIFARRSMRPSTSRSAAAGCSPLHGEGGYIAPLQTPWSGQGPDPADRPLLRAADARLRHPRYRAEGPARPLCLSRHDLRRADTRRQPRRGSPTRSAAMPITWAGWSSSSRPVAGLRSLGLRPSAFIDIGSLWGLKTPALNDILQRLHAQVGYDRANRQDRASPAKRRATLQATRSRPGFKEFFLGNSRQPAPVDRYRRQLDFAVRAAAARPRQGPSPPEGR